MKKTRGNNPRDDGALEEQRQLERQSAELITDRDIELDLENMNLENIDYSNTSEENLLGD